MDDMRKKEKLPWSQLKKMWAGEGIAEWEHEKMKIDRYRLLAKKG